MLLRGAVLAERAPAGGLRRGLEDRVVAEAAGSERPGGDPAAGRASPRHDVEAAAAIRDRPGQGKGQHADVAGTPTLRRQAFEGGEELRIVLFVGRRLAGIAPGPNARSTAEGIDLQSRVIGEGRQAGGAGREAGLDPGVRLESQAVLDRVAGNAQLIERSEVEVGQPLEREQLPELAQLVGRARRDDEPAAAPRRSGQRRTVASAAACASNSRVRPV